MGDIQRAFARAARLREEGRQARQESSALRELTRKQLARTRTLTWEARNSRAQITYRNLLARMRGVKPDLDRLVQEKRELLRRVRALEAQLLGLVEDREAFFDAFERYCAIERSMAAVKLRS